MSLIPMEYPTAGCVILGVLYFFSMQQVCISPISDRPVIFYRYLSAVYCLNAWILSCLLVSHYKTPNDSMLITAIRLFLAWTIIWGSFALTNLAFRTVDAAYKSKVEKSSGAPKWFSILMILVLFLHTIVVILCYILTYILGNAIFIKCYNIFLDILMISGCVGVFVAIISVLIGLNKIIKLSEKLLVHTNNENNKIFQDKKMSIKVLNNIRKQIKNEIELKNSQFIYEQIENDKKKANDDNNKEYENISASEEVIKMLTISNSLNITAIEIEEISKAISSEQIDRINLNKLQRAKRSMNYIIIFVALCFLVTSYDLIDYLISINFTIIIPINSSPYPTTFTYIGHFLFDFTVDLVLILSTYKASNCCTTIAANSFMYICCPLLDCKGKSEEYLNNVNKTIDINGNPLPMQFIINNNNDNNNNNGNIDHNKDETRTEIPEAQFAATPKLHNKTSMTISTLLELPGTKMQRIESLNEDEIVAVIYDLENALLTVSKSLNTMNDNDTDEDEEFDIVKRLTFDQASIAFGGKEGIDLLTVHFDSLIALDVKLFLISKKQCDLIKTILHTVGLLKYFVNNNDPIISDRVIGINHELLQTVTNHQYSLNEKLLKIIEKCGCVNDSVLYIDSDGNTINVEKINLCRTYGVKGTKGLQLTDFKAIQKKYFS